MVAEVLWLYSLQNLVLEKDREGQLDRSCER